MQLQGIVTNALPHMKWGPGESLGPIRCRRFRPRDAPGEECNCRMVGPCYNLFTTVQTFREMLARRPFQPVRITLSSGQSFEIRHPEMALLTRTDLLVGIEVAPDGVPAQFKILSLLHVASIDPLAPQAA